MRITWRDRLTWLFTRWQQFTIIHNDGSETNFYVRKKFLKEVNMSVGFDPELIADVAKRYNEYYELVG